MTDVLRQKHMRDDRRRAQKVAANMIMMPEKDLLIATGNPGKLREMMPQLSSLPQINLHDLSEYKHLSPVDETGKTFLENAILKAVAYAAQTGRNVLADDSGLEVDALDGAPGVYSARYAGASATDADRIALLLKELDWVEKSQRTARFVCVIALASPAARIVNTWTGTCEREIAFRPAGTEGFGYDSIFIPAGYKQTFGQLPPDIKRVISHRAQALRAALPDLKSFFVG